MDSTTFLKANMFMLLNVEFTFLTHLYYDFNEQFSIQNYSLKLLY